MREKNFRSVQIHLLLRASPEILQQYIACSTTSYLGTNPAASSPASPTPPPSLTTTASPSAS